MAAITIVIPTYNRNEQLSDVLDYILQNNTEGLSNVEVIVVDDGSPISAESVIESKKVISPFELKYICQENSGPAVARNNGFRQAKNNMILFIDDDVLVNPMLILQHIEAHQKFPNSAIFGPYPYKKPNIETPAYRYMAKLVDEGIDSLREFEVNNFAKADTVASGNLSLEKKIFGQEVYNPEMTTPVAEEFDLILKLRIQKIPVFVGFDILAEHTQRSFIADKCKQEYKYGLGISEIVIKNPKSLEVPALKNMFFHNCKIRLNDTFQVKLKKTFKFLLSRKYSKQFFLLFIGLCEKVIPYDKILFPLFQLLVGVFFFSGIRDGLKKFQ